MSKGMSFGELINDTDLLITSSTNFIFTNDPGTSIRSAQWNWAGTGLTGTLFFRASLDGTRWSNIQTSALSNSGDAYFNMNVFGKYTQILINPSTGTLTSLKVFIGQAPL